MYKTIKKDGYNLHIIKTKKFKNISIKILFWNDLKKEELSFRNMLVDNLLFSCKKYNNGRKMSIKKQDLYNIDLYSSVYRLGTQVVTEIVLSCINDMYTEKGNFEESLDFLFECLTRPNISNKKFDSNSFSITKERLLAAIKNQKDNPNIYASRRFEEIIGNKKILCGSILGSAEAVEKITTSSLYEYYNTFFNNNHIDIFVLGDVDVDFINDIFDNKFTFKSSLSSYSEVSTTYSKDMTCDIEESSFNQSKLIMGATTKDLSDHEKKYESIIYNIILGNSPKSKLFQTVREKKSYAYTISSIMLRLDGMFIVSAGISAKNFVDTKDEIIKQIEDMKKGKFSLENIKNAKEMICSVLKEAYDSPWSIIDNYNRYLYYDADLLETQLDEIKKVSKNDIINVAKKINIDTIYLLREDTNERN